MGWICGMLTFNEYQGMKYGVIATVPETQLREALLRVKVMIETTARCCVDHGTEIHKSFNKLSEEVNALEMTKMESALMYWFEDRNITSRFATLLRALTELLDLLTAESERIGSSDQSRFESDRSTD